MLKDIPIENILFLDIETVPQKNRFDELSDEFRELWEIKSSYFRKEDEGPAEVYHRAGIYAEFGKVVCISAGYCKGKNKERVFRVKSFFGDDEKQLLTEFAGLLQSHYRHPKFKLCAHNGKEFDFPYLARRMLINGISLPNMLDFAGKKPWEVPHLDTLALWKFGDYKNYTSLKVLTATFGIPTPKDDISGADVYKVYWKDRNLKRIVEYCQKDTLAVAQLFLRFRGEEMIREENVKVI